MKILILALSRSASTAMFYHILSAMPKGTVSLFEPTFDFRPHILESENLLVKWILEVDNPLALEQVTDLFDQIILIVRDPRDRIISSFLFSMHGGVSQSQLNQRLEILARKVTQPRTYPFIKLISDIHPTWNNSATAKYLKSTFESLKQIDTNLKGHLLIKYEDYIGHGKEQVCQFIGVREPPHIRLPVRHEYAKRRVLPADWKNWFTPTDVDLFRPLMTDFLKDFGYAMDWTLPLQPQILKEDTLDFIELAFQKNLLLKKEGITWRTMFLDENPPNCVHGA